jgi:hypothetical protein
MGSSSSNPVLTESENKGAADFHGNILVTSKLHSEFQQSSIVTPMLHFDVNHHRGRNKDNNHGFLEDEIEKFKRVF